MRDKYYHYETGPIDAFWGCIPIEEFLNSEEEQGINCTGIITRLMRECRKFGAWEGDMNRGVLVFALPCDSGRLEMEIGFIWKQSNNGTTFIISPRELPWIEEFRVPRTKEG